MNKLTFRVAIEESQRSRYHAYIPGMMICGTGHSIEEVLENTKSVILDYMPDSYAAVDALGTGTVGSFSGATWHTIEIVR